VLQPRTATWRDSKSQIMLALLRYSSTWAIALRKTFGINPKLHKNNPSGLQPRTKNIATKKTSSPRNKSIVNHSAVYREQITFAVSHKMAQDMNRLIHYREIIYQQEGLAQAYSRRLSTHLNQCFPSFIISRLIITIATRYHRRSPHHSANQEK
jgi:hypothetical protein